MFNLKQAVSDWRQQLFATGIISPDVLDELEAHLWEDIERQTKSGTNAQRAFGIAVQNLGKVDAIIHEFRKFGASSVAEKLMIGICAVFVGFIMFLSALGILLCYATWGDRMVASAAVACILLVACGWRYAVPFLPMIPHNRLRWAVGLACIASGFILSSIFCNFILPHFEFGPDHQLPAIGLWAVFLITVFACMGVGLMLSERQRKMWGMTNASVINSTSPIS
jgi:hypothetical protein